MRKQLQILLLVLFATNTLAENEASYYPDSNTVTIPQVIIVDGKENAQVTATLTYVGDGNFKLTQIANSAGGPDTAVEKYLKSADNPAKRWVYGQLLKRIYSTALDTVRSKSSLPPYVTDYVNGAEIRVYQADNDALVAKTSSDRNGFYQIPLSRAGKYKICVGATNEACSTFTLGASSSQRCNYNDLASSGLPSVSCTAY